MGIRSIAIASYFLVSTVFTTTILQPKTCRAPLPVEWFISEFQSLPTFSKNITDMTADASETLASVVNATFTNIPGIDAMSVVVAAPWGVSEYHIGKLKANDSTDSRIVDGNSIYRVGSMTKVRPYNEICTF